MKVALSVGVGQATSRISSEPVVVFPALSSD